jgi:hypothetical protein
MIYSFTRLIQINDSYKIVLLFLVIAALTTVTACEQVSVMHASIDASSEEAYQQSMSDLNKRMNQQESDKFRSALQDIATKIGLAEALSLSMPDTVITSLQNDFRSVIHHKTPNEVIAFASKFDGFDIRAKYDDAFEKAHKELS